MAYRTIIVCETVDELIELVTRLSNMSDVVISLAKSTKHDDRGDDSDAREQSISDAAEEMVKTPGG